MDLLNFGTAYNGLQEFLETGGIVLVWIMMATFVMWAFILERFAYYGLAHKRNVTRTVSAWSDRTDKTSWTAHAIRDQLISEVRQKTETNVNMIKTLVAIAPLLGLLGTVTGMVEVFDVMAISGSSNARAMAAGVSKATIPTMAGMVAALSGMFFSNLFERRIARESAKLADKLEIHTA